MQADRQDGADDAAALDRDTGDAQGGRLTGVPLLIAALSVVLFVQAAFVLSYVGALHHPTPHDVAFGVVGGSTLPSAVGKQFSLKVTRYPDESAARDAIEHRKIDGAFVAGPRGRDADRRPDGRPRRRKRSHQRVRGRRDRLPPEDRGRPGSQAPVGRCDGNRLVPARHGPDHRRLSLLHDRHGVRRTGDTETAPRRPRDRRGDRGAPHGHVRRAGARRRSHLEVPGAVGPLHAGDDGRRLRDRCPADRARTRRARWSWSSSS